MNGWRIIHTDMPLMPLSLLVGEYARIEVDKANAGTEGACFYGWGEARNGSDCPPHHLVFTTDETFLLAIASTLVDMGQQVVITDYQDWSQVISTAPQQYNNHHQH